jgi:AcrR family transcriptional regulator
MKIKAQILEAARELFNQQGLMNVTLREIAQNLNRAYGNITYHFANKETLVEDLYHQYHEKLQSLNSTFPQNENLLATLLHAPRHTYALSCQYTFFFVDYVELQRHFPVLSAQIHHDNQQRKAHFLQLLQLLQMQGYLREDQTTEDLHFLMECSGILRTHLFIGQQFKHQAKEEAEQEYLSQTNALLKPYLTPAGLQVYGDFQLQQ